MFKKFMLPVLALGLFSFAGCGSSDGGKPVDDAEAKKAADAAAQDVKDSESASKKLVGKRKAK